MGLGPLGDGELAIQCCSQFGEFKGEFERWLTGVQCKQMSKKEREKAASSASTEDSPLV